MIDRGELVIEPPPADRAFQPASVELTLSGDYCWSGRQRRVEELWLSRGDFILASTLETVKIPDNLVAQVNGKSSLARKGLVIHQTAGFIDPGFHGQVTLELSNVGEPIRLTPGMPICQLAFMLMTSPAQRPYGHKALGSHYQGQQGPTPSAL